MEVKIIFYLFKKEWKKIPFPSIWLWCHCNWVIWKVELEPSDLLQVVVVWTNSLIEKSLTRDPESHFPAASWIEFEIFMRRFLNRRWGLLLTLIEWPGVDTQPPMIINQQAVIFYKNIRHTPPTPPINSAGI